jgi:hypothetical protein
MSSTGGQMVLGHVASSVLAARALKLDTRVVVLAGLLPDLVDKATRYVLHVVPFGRLPSHTLLGLALTTLAVYGLGRIRGDGTARTLAWFVGYAAHLVLDFARPLPLLWPFVAYEWPDTYTPFDWIFEPIPWSSWLSLALEGALVVAATWVARRRLVRRARTPAPTARVG